MLELNDTTRYRRVQSQTGEGMTEYFDVVVIGGGQAGLAAGYHLARRGLHFVILDAHERVGDAWRKRWDSLRLFTPAWCDELPGMPFPAPAHHFPTKDEMADYLESYAIYFNLPIRTGVRVTALSKEGDRFVVMAGDLCFEAKHVVVAMSNWQVPHVPAFAQELDPAIHQLHAIEYRNPSQLREGGVLVVGAGNSGAEIALDAACDHPTWLAGKHPGIMPFDIESLLARFVIIPIVVKLFFYHLATINTPIGRKVRAEMFGENGELHGQPLLRTKPKHLDAAGIKRVPRVAGVRDGLPLLEDQQVLKVENIVWCTGFRPSFSWINLPVFEDGMPVHQRGVVTREPGLYFVGLAFQYAASSSMVQGVGRDAEHVVKVIMSQLRAEQQSPARRSVYAVS